METIILYSQITIRVSSKKNDPFFTESDYFDAEYWIVIYKNGHFDQKLWFHYVADKI